MRDGDALRELLLDPRFREGLVRIAESVIPTCLRQDLDDIVQDSFIAALEKLPSFRGSTGSLMAWMVTIVRNRALNLYRQRRESRVVLDGDMDLSREIPAETSLAPSNLLIAQDLLAALSPVQRDVVLMRVAYGLDTAEVATALGMSADAVRQNLSRGLRRLHRIAERIEHPAEPCE